MYQIRYDLGNRYEYSMYFESEWVVHHMAEDMVRRHPEILRADVLDKRTHKIIKTYTK